MEETFKLPVCCRCKKEIKEVAFIKTQPAIVLQQFFTQIPPIFKCPEHAENYAKGMQFHSDCYIAELREHGVEIHDMDEVVKRYSEAFTKAVIPT